MTVEGIVNATDAVRAGENLVGRTLGGAFVAARCNVIGSSDGGVSEYDVADVASIERFTNGKPASIGGACQAYPTPP